jgi:D-alanyl-lipoteichoic acid acyltransferase DltB (MBOAT superfamily)
MAIGCAKVLGLDLMLNFRRPYLSTSVGEFWGRDRWHISLNTWFRDYMYIPMGGSRVPPLRRYFNLMAVFVVSGLWHGAAWTFVIWGALNGVYLVIETMFRGTGAKIRDGLRLPHSLGAILASILTFILILITWVFFRATSIEDAITVFTRIFEGAGSLWNTIAIRLSEPAIQFGFAMIILLMVIEIIDEKTEFWANLRIRPRVLRWAVYYALILLLVIGGSWELREFVYMQF